MIKALQALQADDLQRMNAIQWWHRIAVGLDEHGKIIYTPGEVVHGPDGGIWPHSRFGIPHSLAGKTVLDVGAWDGFFSFFCEELGASHVLAMDVTQSNGGHWGGLTSGFEFAKRMRESEVEFQEGDIQYKTFDSQFDLVLSYGVLYHVTNPFSSIENLYRATAKGGTCIIETAVEMRDTVNLESWNRHPGFASDPTNKWYPTRAGLKATCEQFGFTNYEMVADVGQRVTVKMIKN